MEKEFLFPIILVLGVCLFTMIFMYVNNVQILATLTAEQPLEDCSIKDNKAKDYNLMQAVAEAEHKYGVCLGNLMQLVVEYNVEYVRTYDKNVVECWKRCNE